MSSGLIRFVVAGLLALAAAVPPCGLRPAGAGHAPQLRPTAIASPAAASGPGAGGSSPVAEAKPKRRPRRILRPPLRGANPPSRRRPARVRPAKPSISRRGPFAYIEGKADKDEIYSAILNSLSLVKRDMDKANLAPSGRPLAVFVESDDTGFKYHAGYPLAAAPEGKSSLSDAVKIGQTPSGKAMRFEHQGAYGDIDATYDAITAYLDDKGIDAQDTFVEEYANDVKDPDDPTLQVNIYVLLK